MANSFKPVIDRQAWVQVMGAPNVHAAGMGICCDLRNTVSRNPFVYQLASATVMNRYNIKTKGWGLAVNPGISAFAAGAGCVFAPSANLKGAIGAGCTNTTIVTTTAIATAPGLNMLANRGGDGTYGFRVRIIGSAAGSSGKIEERWIVGNTASATPTLTLDTALTFTPVSGDTYEILSGSVYSLGSGALAATSWRSYEVGCNILTSRTNTNLAATISTDFAAAALDEQYVPYDALPGEGMITGAGTYNGGTLKCLTATVTAGSSITGQANDGDASVLQNEYRNFQIRIVEDTAAPTAVNQRRMIASHTAGSSPVYSLGTAWSVQPSATAKFVIELPNLILLRSSGTAVVYTYNYSGATINNGTNSIVDNAWSATYFGNAGGVMGAGCCFFPSFGIRPDPGKNARHSHIHCFRGAGAVTLDVLDIAGGTTGAWSNAVTYDGGMLLNTGSCGKYAPSDQGGQFAYLNFYTASALNQIFRYDVKNRVLAPYTPTDWIQAGTAAAGDRLATFAAIDGTDKYTVILLVAHTAANAMELVVEL